MSDNDFVSDDLLEVVYRDVYRAACEDVVSQLEQPSGRKPTPRTVKLHEWYEKLGDQDRKFLKDIVSEAADAAVFGMLCLLDNVRPVSKGFKTELRVYVATEGRDSPLPISEELHAAFRYLVDTRDRSTDI